MNASEFHIHIVEDSLTDIDFLALNLSEYNLSVAKKGQQVLQLIAKGIVPDLLLMNIELPDINGYELCRKIRNNKELNDTPIIFLTSKSDKNSVVKGLEVGGQDYITKPFDSNELKARINTHLELKVNREKLKEVNKWLENEVDERTKNLQKALKELKSTNKELDTFIYRASHDLKGPVATLLGLIQLGKIEVDDDTSQSLFNKQQVITKQLNGLIDKLLLKHEMALKPVTYTKVDLPDLIKRVQHNLPYPQDSYRLNIYFDNEQIIYSDANLLSIILDNLIENAILYNYGIIEINITVSISTKHLRFAVKDNGDGIDKDIKPNIFKLFYRGSYKSTGNGLGLYLVKNAIDKLGGKINVSSVKNKGSEFSISIPFKNKKVNQKSSSNNKNILKN